MDTLPGPLALSLSLVVEHGATIGVAEDDLANLAGFVLEAEDAGGPWEITVALVDDARLQALHHEFMGSDTPTDIMTFPLDGAEAPISGGDLVISADHALTQAAAWDHTAADEVEFLVVHGLLHLLGWRDEEEDQRQRMLDRQRELHDRWRQESATLD